MDKVDAIAAPPRTLPAIDADNRTFWTGGSDGALMIMRCRACSHYIHPPVRFCPACESRDTVPVAVSGRATIHSFTVNHKAWLPGLAVPYVLALVQLSGPDRKSGVWGNSVSASVDLGGR